MSKTTLLWLYLAVKAALAVAWLQPKLGKEVVVVVEPLAEVVLLETVEDVEAVAVVLVVVAVVGTTSAQPIKLAVNTPTRQQAQKNQKLSFSSLPDPFQLVFVR